MNQPAITINTLADINWDSIQAVAYEEVPLRIGDELLGVVENGRRQFQHLIDQGVPCYGITTGLGQLVSLTLSPEEKDDLPHNILRARSAAIGPPLPRPVVRAMMMMRLVNFLSGMDGVTVTLCQFLVARLNDGFTPWVPTLGHGMGADAIAHTHAFQTFIGEGFVMDEGGERIPASAALEARHVEPMRLAPKEGLALLNGISAAPAYALDAHRHLLHMLDLATAVAALSCEGGAVPKDSFDPMLKQLPLEPGVAAMIDQLAPFFENSQISPYKLQSAISFRIIPQVHGALWDALAQWQERIMTAVYTFSDNPLMVTDDSEVGGRFLSVGLFHNQHLVNQADQVALALAHVANLSARRLHRLLSASNTGLTQQLAGRPGLDAGLVVAHKAAIGLTARIIHLANPVSIQTNESSSGQEDYMSMAFPTIARLYDMVTLGKMVLAYECLGGMVALSKREQRAGDGVTAVQQQLAPLIPTFEQDESPGPVVERIVEAFTTLKLK